MAAVKVHSDFGAQENKVGHHFHFYPSICHLREKEYIYMNDWVPMLFTWNYHNIFNQLFSSVQLIHSVVPDSLWLHGLQHTRFPCPSPTTGAYSNSHPSRWWCHPTISSSVIPFSSHLQSFPVSGSFPKSWFFASGTGVSASASVLPMNIQDWLPLRLTGWISLQPKGLSRVFSNTTVQKQQFFGAQLSW